MENATLATRINTLPHSRVENIDREIQLAINTVTYADSVYWSGQAGHAAVRELLQVNFLDSLVFVYNIVAQMVGEQEMLVPHKANFSIHWRREKLPALIRQINEARYLASTDAVTDTRDEFRIPAVQSLHRAKVILRSIIDDFTQHD